VQTLLDSSRTILRPLGRSDTSSGSPYPLAVDPRPFRTGTGDPVDGLRIASLATLLRDQAVEEARTQELKRLGVPLGNVLAFKDCPGVMVPAPEKRICPGRDVLVAIVSLPEARGARSFVQVLVMATDSRAKTVLDLGFVMQSTGGRWTLVEQRIPIIVE
jgi:hypothetical protein